MKMKWFAGAALAAALAVPSFKAHAQASFGITIGTPPPPIRYEARPVMPGPGYVWVDGYWGVRGNRYVWVPGHWDRAPYEGAYWVHPHYDHYDRGWVYREGYWSHERRPDAYEHWDWDHHRDGDHDGDRDHDRH